jgi:hypothetical protein
MTISQLEPFLINNLHINFYNSNEYYLGIDFDLIMNHQKTISIRLYLTNKLKPKIEFHSISQSIPKSIHQFIQLYKYKISEILWILEDTILGNSDNPKFFQYQQTKTPFIIKSIHNLYQISKKIYPKFLNILSLLSHQSISLDHFSSSFHQVKFISPDELFIEDIYSVINDVPLQEKYIICSKFLLLSLIPMTLQTQSFIPLFIHPNNFSSNCIQSLLIVSDSLHYIEQQLILNLNNQIIDLDNLFTHIESLQHLTDINSNHFYFLHFQFCNQKLNFFIDYQLILNLLVGFRFIRNSSGELTIEYHIFYDFFKYDYFYIILFNFRIIVYYIITYLENIFNKIFENFSQDLIDKIINLTKEYLISQLSQINPFTFDEFIHFKMNKKHYKTLKKALSITISIDILPFYDYPHPF